MKISTLLAAAILTLAGSAFGQISFSGSYTNDFDGMGASGTVMPAGWLAIRYAGSGTAGAALTPVVDNGGANSGAIYNVGTTASGERALGTLASGTTVPRFGASFMNATATTFDTINFFGFVEQWRSGSSSGVNEAVAFEYSLNASGINDGAATWVPLTSFNLFEIQTGTTTAAALDGNLLVNQSAISASTAISWTPGVTLSIRWSDADNTGADANLALDNFGMTAFAPVPEPSAAGLVGIGLLGFLLRRKAA
jgi:hypothetical protein